MRKLNHTGVTLFIMVLAFLATSPAIGLDRVIDFDLVIPKGATTTGTIGCYKEIMSMHITVTSKKGKYNYIRPIRIQDTETKKITPMTCRTGKSV